MFVALPKGIVGEQVMRHQYAVAVFVLAGIVAGCGGGERHDQYPATARSGRFEMTIVANEPGRTVVLRATGSFDDERHRYSLVTDAGSLVPGIDSPVSVIAVPDAVYVDCPYLTRLLGSATKWIVVRGAGSELVRTSIIDVPQRLDTIRRAGGLVTRTTMRFAGGGSGGDVLVSLQYFDIGAPVIIEPPAAEQVTDETDAVNRLFGGTTGG